MRYVASTGPGGLYTFGRLRLENWSASPSQALRVFHGPAAFQVCRDPRHVRLSGMANAPFACQQSGGGRCRQTISIGLERTESVVLLIEVYIS